jgi:hypothetical protein
VAIDRCSRSVYLAVKDDETEKSAIAFLREAAATFPFHLTHVLTDNGTCFTPAFAQACAELGAEYRHTKPYTPQTNGMVERFNGRVSREVEVLGITIYSHRDLEQLLRGFNAAYNARRQRVLDGKTPHQVVAERLQAKRRLARAKPRGQAGPNDILKARLVVEAAKEVSQPDNYDVLEVHGVKPCLTNARHRKSVPGRRTDWHECQWLQYLHSVGLLRAAFRPEADVCAMRAVVRHRGELVEMAVQHVQHMQKALTQMNLQIHHVISDITGSTGLAIIDAILEGERGSGGTGEVA